MAAVAWSVCVQRNDRLWNSNGNLCLGVGQTGLDILAKWQAAQIGRHPSLARSHNHQVTDSRWTMPPKEFLKCNLDAAIFGSISVMGTGFVIRDGLGVVVWLLEIEGPLYS